MKRFSIVMASALTLGLSACGGAVDEGNNGSAENSSANSEAAADFTPNDVQRRAMDFARATLMETVSCSGSADMVQSKIDDYATGNGSLADAYAEARSGAKSCASALQALKEEDLSHLGDAKPRSIAKQAVDTCIGATEKRIAAMGKAKVVLKGEGDLDAAADYKDAIRSAKNDEASCRLMLAGVPEYYKVPDSALDFLN